MSDAKQFLITTNNLDQSTIFRKRINDFQIKMDADEKIRFQLLLICKQLMPIMIMIMILAQRLLIVIIPTTFDMQTIHINSKIMMNIF